MNNYLLITTKINHHCFSFKQIKRRFPLNIVDILFVNVKQKSNYELVKEEEEKELKIIFFFLKGIIMTFNSSSFIDYHYSRQLEYPLHLSLRFRTLGRISNGVLLSLIHRKTSSLIIPFIIIEHSNGKIEITILELDERKVLSTVTVSRPPEKQFVYLKIKADVPSFLIFKHFPSEKKRNRRQY